MSSIVAFLRTVGRGIVSLVRLVRDGEDDLRGTYPDHRGVSGPEAATQASVATNLMGMGNGGM